MVAMKILVPIDFSDCSVNALRYAVALGQKMQAELILFHAFHIPIGGDATFFVDTEMVKQWEHSMQHRLFQLAASLPELKEISYQNITNMALATEGILKAIREYQIDLIVMGTRGANHLLEEWLGSTTYNVVRKASCPVIALPDTVQRFHLQKIVIASDLRAMDNPSGFSFLRNLAKQLGASIHILHVHPQPETLGTDKGEETVVLDELFYDIPHTFHFPKGTAVEEEVEHFIQTNAIDMLAMVPRKHNLLERLFLQRMTKKMTLHTTVPLLSVYA